MIVPRVIVVVGCKSCPHAHDWSSGGLECEHPERRHGEDRPGGRTIVPGYAPRAPFKHAVPDWCPLPQAPTLVYPQSSERNGNG